MPAGARDTGAQLRATMPAACRLLLAAALPSTAHSTIVQQKGALAACRFRGAQQEFMNVQMYTTISRINVSYCPTPTAAATATATAAQWSCATAPTATGIPVHRMAIEDACAHSIAFRTSMWEAPRLHCKYLVSQVAAASIDCLHRTVHWRRPLARSHSPHTHTYFLSLSRSLFLSLPTFCSFRNVLHARASNWSRVAAAYSVLTP